MIAISLFFQTDKILDHLFQEWFTIFKPFYKLKNPHEKKDCVMWDFT